MSRILFHIPEEGSQVVVGRAPVHNSSYQEALEFLSARMHAKTFKGAKSVFGVHLAPCIFDVRLRKVPHVVHCFQELKLPCRSRDKTCHKVFC